MCVGDLPGDICSSLVLFADDTRMCGCVQSAEDAEALQAGLGALSQWSAAWQLPFGVDRCKVLHFGRGSLGHQCAVCSLGKDGPVAAVEEERDLGILFDGRLRFSSHVGSCISGAGRRIGVVRGGFKFLNQGSFLTICSSMVGPILECASSVWYTVCGRDGEAVERVQRGAAGLLLHLRGLPCPGGLGGLDLPSLVCRRRVADLVQVCRIVHRVDVASSQEFFSFTGDSVARGHSLGLSRDGAESGLGQGVFGSGVVHGWSSLKENAVASVSLDRFGNRLEGDWRDKEFKFGPALCHAWLLRSRF